tara:strand:+ start:965 stop:1168 length:204 start_codon:yes stop_codon:yes gene_type:complete
MSYRDIETVGLAGTYVPSNAAGLLSVALNVEIESSLSLYSTPSTVRRLSKFSAIFDTLEADSVDGSS